MRIVAAPQADDHLFLLCISPSSLPPSFLLLKVLNSVVHDEPVKADISLVVPTHADASCVAEKTRKAGREWRGRYAGRRTWRTRDDDDSKLNFTKIGTAKIVCVRLGGCGVSLIAQERCCPAPLKDGQETSYPRTRAAHAKKLRASCSEIDVLEHLPPPRTLRTLYDVTRLRPVRLCFGLPPTPIHGRVWPRENCRAMLRFYFFKKYLPRTVLAPVRDKYFP